MSHQSFLDVGLPRLTVGEHFELAGAEARHAKVKRIAGGEVVDVTDGSGRRVTCTVVDEAEPARLRVDRIQIDEAPSVAVTLVQALAKGDRDLQAVETCVEIGVDAVTPWQAERSIVRWRGERAAKAHAKWEAQVASAVKQSRRAWLPPVQELADTTALGARVRTLADAGGLALVLHEEAQRPLAAAVREWHDGVGPGPARDIMLVVGPEGGIGDQELARLLDSGATAVSVGDHVLRASTAGAVGLVLSRAVLGHYD